MALLQPLVEELNRLDNNPTLKAVRKAINTTVIHTDNPEELRALQDFETRVNALGRWNENATLNSGNLQLAINAVLEGDKENE